MNEPAGGAGPVVDVGAAEQLFLDDAVVEHTENITRRVNPARKHPTPLVKRDRPWERGRLLVFGTVLYDDEDRLFKMWYYSDGDVGYATSPDGLAWDKPELDVVERDGRKTNLVIERERDRTKRGRFGYFYELFNVIKDPRDPDTARRYKAAAVGIHFNYTGPHRAPFHSGQRRGVLTYVSPDGIHWTLETDWASHEVFDGLSYFLWDERIQRYVLYGRTKLTPETNDGRWRLWGWGRAVNRIESPDFRSWSAGELVLAADAKDPEGAEIYSTTVFPYAGQYVGLVQMFRGLSDQGNLEIQLACSRDGRRFTRVEPRDPFIAEGPVGSWDRFNISVASNPVVRGDDLWFYYSGRPRRHSPYKGADTGSKAGCIGLVTVKRGRFLSLEASYDGGTVLTRPLRVQGGRLLLNANAAYGSIVVTLLDAQGQAVPGWRYVLRGADGVAVPVRFAKGALAPLAGVPVRIRFALKNAQLYGFRFEP